MESKNYLKCRLCFSETRLTIVDDFVAELIQKFIIPQIDHWSKPEYLCNKCEDHLTTFNAFRENVLEKQKEVLTNRDPSVKRKSTADVHDTCVEYVPNNECCSPLQRDGPPIKSENLDTEIRSDNDLSHPRHKCLFCDESFKSAEILDIHSQKRHNFFKCEWCIHTSTVKHCYVKHMQGHEKATFQHEIDTLSVSENCSIKRPTLSHDFQPRPTQCNLSTTQEVLQEGNMQNLMEQEKQRSKDDTISMTSSEVAITNRDTHKKSFTSDHFHKESGLQSINAPELGPSTSTETTQRLFQPLITRTSPLNPPINNVFQRLAPPINFSNKRKIEVAESQQEFNGSLEDSINCKYKRTYDTEEGEVPPHQDDCKISEFPSRELLDQDQLQPLGYYHLRDHITQWVGNKGSRIDMFEVAAPRINVMLEGEDGSKLISAVLDPGLYPSIVSEKFIQKHAGCVSKSSEKMPLVRRRQLYSFVLLNYLPNEEAKVLKYKYRICLQFVNLEKNKSRTRSFSFAVVHGWNDFEDTVFIGSDIQEQIKPCVLAGEKILQARLPLNREEDVYFETIILDWVAIKLKVKVRGHRWNRRKKVSYEPDPKCSLPMLHQLYQYLEEDCHYRAVSRQSATSIIFENAKIHPQLQQVCL